MNKSNDQAVREARRLHTCPGAGFDFGFIPPELAAAVQLAAGPIRLQAGFPGQNGYGHDHIYYHGQGARLKRIRALGFATVPAFIAAIAQSYTDALRCEEPNRLHLTLTKDATGLHMIVEYKTEGFWSVTTAFPARAARGTVVWTRPST